MTTFFDLFLNHSSPPFRDDPSWADRQFPALIASSPFRIWRPGDSLVARANRYLIGVATWNGYDMRLLDAIAEALAARPTDPPIVEVFNTVDCRQQQDFDSYIRGIGFVSQTPIVGFWHKGELVRSEQGHAAREFLAGVFELNSAEIVAFVQDQIEARTHA